MAKKNKADILAEEVKKAVGAGRVVAVETVDFSDPNRPLTCLEVDFPIIPVNELAAVETASGAGRKPIYAMAKWWARRPSSVFRGLLLSASMKAPQDPLEAGKSVWDVYYANHQKMKALSHIKVVDPFMGGGTTVVEGSRLGMQMLGVDLNPVAWFICKTELAQVDKPEVEALLAEVEAVVKPQIMPFYACDCPRGHKGTWTRVSTGRVMGDDFDALALTPDERRDYRYAGPEIIYVFWAKHGPCQVTGCGHRTPIMSSPVVAVKSISTRSWALTCRNAMCRRAFDIEENDVRMAPGVPLVVAGTERPYTIPTKVHSLHASNSIRVDITCPACGHRHEQLDLLDRSAERKKVELSLLVHPRWLAGESATASDGSPFGGTATSTPDATAAWCRARAQRAWLFEVRGRLPDEVADPLTGTAIKTGKHGGTVPKRSAYSCGACGTVQDVLDTVKASGTTGPVAAYAVQGYCPECDSTGAAYNGRFFAAAEDSTQFTAAAQEWHSRKIDDLSAFWPKSEIPYGFMTAHANGDIREGHGFTHWWTLFNERELLVVASLLKAITTVGQYPQHVREVALNPVLRFLQHNNMLCFWDIQQDCLAPSLSNQNFHPKNTVIENSVFASLGRGNFRSSVSKLRDALDWTNDPWDLASNDRLSASTAKLSARLTGKSTHVHPGDHPRESPIGLGSATDLASLSAESIDLVVTDPPFGGLLHYSELSDFFYVWLRLVLKDRYPDNFTTEYVPKSLEIVENRARNPDDPAGFYQRLLTAAWTESARILKAGGILAFTFHHSEDEPWVQVLESLFDAGFYLEATYPIRSDETKGEGEFGARKVEYDIIHVCRKRTFEPTPVSWAKMRRVIQREVQRLKDLLQHHQREGLPEADIQVIKRGKALEYYSRHYGQVYEAEGQALSVKDAVLGVLQVIDEPSDPSVEHPPVIASPYTRQLLRMYLNTTEQPRNQVQKFLRGTGIAPSEFEDRGWIYEDRKVFYLTPFVDVAQAWQRKHRVGMVHDYDQASCLIGACFEGSGIKAEDTLSNPNFKPHPALGSLLEWFCTRSKDPKVRTAAGRAERLFKTWQARHQQVQSTQIRMFGDPGGDT